MIQSVKGKLSNLNKSTNKEEVFDSLLERDYMYYLENLSNVKEWTKKHGIQIPYYFFGLKKKYLPDFLVTFQDGRQEIHETKGAGFLEWLTTHYKREAADKWCKERNMVYRFIENSKGLLFANNNSINQFGEKKNFNSLDDLLKQE